ncbi:FAD-binding domain-containing protein [Trichoderma chlorosporum]
MTSPQFNGADLLACPFTIPDFNSSATELLARWSDTFIESPPAIIITPNTEQDVVSAVNFARLNNLTIVPVGGRHGSAIPINSKVLYLDLKNLQTIILDKQKEQVHIGGGILTGDLLRHLYDQGYFTAVVNSNAVGVVGSLLGGGNTSVNGLVSWMGDSVLSLRVITAAGEAIQVGSSSTGEELALFNVLCGAGHGLCVVVAATMRIYPLSGLNLSPTSKDDATPSIWSRTMIFPSTAIDAAVDAFLAIAPPPEPMNVIFGFSRGPPGTPLAGKPIIILTGTYYGPASEAEASPAGSSLLSPSLVEKALKAETVQIPFPNVNNGVEPLNAHGGFKSMSSARIARLSPQAVKAAFAKYLAVTEKHPDAARTAFMFHSFNPSKLAQLGTTPEGQAKFIEARERGFCTVGVMWCSEPATREALVALFDDATAVLQKDDEELGLAPRVFSGTMKFLSGRRDLLSQEKLSELDRVQSKWNGDGLFWSPYTA